MQLIPTPESNKSLQVSGLYYGRLLSFIKHYIDATITEMESTQTSVEATNTEAVETDATEAKGAIAVETPEFQIEPLVTEDIETVENGETDDDIEDWPIPENQPTPNNSSELSTDEAIATLLECQTKLQLMSKKKDIGEELAKKAWDEMTLVQRNYLQLISLRENVTKPLGTLGYQLLYQPTKDSKPRKARLIGFYLYGDKLPLADERAVLIDGETQPTICSKAHLRPLKNSTPPTELEIKQLEKLLAEPQETEPTPEDMAANTFTGLATAPKLLTGSQDGSPPDLPASRLNDAVQAELDLKTEPTPKPEVEVVPTPLLEAIATEVKKGNPELCFTYDTNGKSVFLQVEHGDSKIGTFEDDGENLWTIGCKAMTFHGFTEEQIDALAEIELSPKA
ncbi:MAG: hypothetical protein AAGA80_05285 [Cyanobacteria bacterium P01_F01_bin.143]